MARMLRVAAAQYPVEAIISPEAYEAKLSIWVAEAAAAKAELLVFPEYSAMELGFILGLESARDLKASLTGLQTILPVYKETHKKLAARHGVFILGGSAPLLMADGRYVNRARLYAPDGRSAYQEKLMMTRFEREEWGISAPAEPQLAVFDTGKAKIGVAICYDTEFPMLVRLLCDAGADIILVPSCTDTLAGYHRVKHAAQARALENQCYVVQAPTVGEAEWSAAVDVNVGAAGFFAPPDRLFPPDGVLAVGALNEPGWVYCDLDLDLLAEVRAHGEVLNRRDWPYQPGAAAAARIVHVPLS